MTYPYETATPKQRKLGSLWWCIHHHVMLEPLTEPVNDRVQYIRKHKPTHEVETRLRAMRPAVGPFPKAVLAAAAALMKAEAALGKAEAALGKAEAAREKANAVWEKAEAEWKKANAVWEKAEAAREKADAACEKAHAAWVNVIDCDEVRAAFARECPDVKWGPDGLVFEVKP